MPQLRDDWLGVFILSNLGGSSLVSFRLSFKPIHKFHGFAHVLSLSKGFHFGLFLLTTRFVHGIQQQNMVVVGKHFTFLLIEV